MRLFRRRSGLSVRVVPDGTITPMTPFPTTRHRHSVKLGVFDRDDRLVRESLLFRSYGQIGFKAPLGPEPGRDGRRVIFAGHRTNAFGHLLLEGLSRLWYAKAHPDLPIVWACRRGTQSDLLPWQRDILGVVGLRNEVILLREETRFRAVHVPEPGYRIKDWFSKQQADFLARYPARARDAGLKLWLSRSGLPFEDRSLHADRLEGILAEHGWTIFQPERHPIEEQLSMLASASRVAGEQGSAFHLVVLLADVRGLELDILCRDPRLSAEEQNQNYQTIGDMRGLVQRLHVIPEERVLNVKGPHVRKLASTLAGHLEALGITRDPEQPPDRPRPVATFAGATARSIGARSYLEVGREGWGAWPELAL
jgi:hypothetical protein